MAGTLWVVSIPYRQATGSFQKTRICVENRVSIPYRQATGARWTVEAAHSHIVSIPYRQATGSNPLTGYAGFFPSFNSL